MGKAFSDFARRISIWAGSSRAFVLALVSIIVWASFGPHYEYSDSWSLVVNTGTTIVTFLMVFLIQNSQNRDMAALQVKLDEILRAIPQASNTIVAIDVDSDEDKIQQVREEVKGEALHGR